MAKKDKPGSKKTAPGGPIPQHKSMAMGIMPVVSGKKTPA